MNKTFTVEVLQSDEDPDDCMIPIPDELMKEQGWNIGDELSFEINTDYSIIMRKSNDNDPVDVRSSIIRLDKPEK